jgi:hypothetical protein
VGRRRSRSLLVLRLPASPPRWTAPPVATGRSRLRRRGPRRCAGRGDRSPGPTLAVALVGTADLLACGNPPAMDPRLCHVRRRRAGVSRDHLRAGELVHSCPGQDRSGRRLVRHIVRTDLRFLGGRHRCRWCKRDPSVSRVQLARSRSRRLHRRPTAGTRPNTALDVATIEAQRLDQLVAWRFVLWMSLFCRPLITSRWRS